jgi:glycerol-3-phosphate dehydrogenase (NAD(P)+)
MNITVLSDGGWGTALALLLIRNGHNVRQWGPFPDYISEIRKSRENSRFLPGARLPDELVLCEEMKDAVDDSEIIVLASPSQYLRGTLAKFAEYHEHDKHILVNVAKGIEIGSLKRMSELCVEILGKNRYCVLSGPSHAEEVALKSPTAIVAAATDVKTAEIVQNAFMNEFFRVYTSTDEVGVELGGSLKNVFAIASGILDGMGLGDNSKAALMTRGIAEMARLGVALGGRNETFSGLSGIGDLIVTCISRHSRNRHVGEELGKGRKIEEVLKEMGFVVAEGVKTAESAYNLALKYNVETPIINEIYAGLYLGKDPRKGARDLMTRKARKEF